MRKKLLFLSLALIIITGCSTSAMESSVTRIFSGSTGYVYVASLVEVKSNFSSLLYDKSKAKPENFYEAGYAKIGPDAILHVLPVQVYTPYDSYYDEGTKTILKNYIVLNKFGNVTENSNDNDYFVITTIKESLQSTFGENMSQIEITIVDRNNVPYYFSKVDMVSRSDKNFWYYPHKGAKPVSYLTLKGVNHILTSSLNKAFQES